jgi:YfiH family protein
MTLPSLSESFYWSESPCGTVLKCRPLEVVARHVFTTRELQLSSSEAWVRVGAALGVSQVATIKQVHGREVVSIRRASPRPQEMCSGDALVSDDPDVAVAVLSADCVPLLVADSRTGAVAAVHAGWRGTAAGAAAAVVDALARECGAKPDDLVVALGPSIGPCCYEVGSELVDAFAAAGHPRHLIDRWFLSPRSRGRVRPVLGGVEGPKLRLDVAGANRDQLILAGVPDAQIHVAGVCTAMHLEVLTSYRVEKGRAGRLAGAIAPPRSGASASPMFDRA